MKLFLTLTLMLASSMLAAENQTTLCEFDEKQRKIEVVYPKGGENVCEVQYTKNGEMTVLWTARSEREFCQTKASGFIEKQQGWGWKCESQLASSDDEQLESTTEDNEVDSAESVENAESEIK